MKSSLATKLALAVSGLVFLVAAGGYPLCTELWHAAWRMPGHSSVAPMFGCLYVVLGAGLLLALRNPPAYRPLILFAAWSSLAHAAVMGVQWAQSAGTPDAPGDFGLPVALFAVLGLALLAGRPPRAEPKVAVSMA